MLLPSQGARLMPETRPLFSGDSDRIDEPARRIPLPGDLNVASEGGVESSGKDRSPLDISFKTDDGPSTVDDGGSRQSKQAGSDDQLRFARFELQKTRSDLKVLIQERKALVQSYEEYIERLNNENRRLALQAGGEDLELSRRLRELEEQNSKIIEDLRGATARLAESERTHITRISELCAEKQELEARVSALVARSQESLMAQSKLDSLSGELERSRSELERKTRDLDAATRERRRLEEELADARGFRDSQLQQLSSKLEQLIQLVSSKDQEIDELRKEIERNSLAPSPTLGLPDSLGPDPQEFAAVRAKNLELSQQLQELRKRYDQLSEERLDRERANAFSNPFLSGDDFRPPESKYFTPPKNDVRPPAHPASETRTERVSRVILNGRVVYNRQDVDPFAQSPQNPSRLRSASNPVKHELALQFTQQPPIPNRNPTHGREYFSPESETKLSERTCVTEREYGPAFAKSPMRTIRIPRSFPHSEY